MQKELKNKKNERITISFTEADSDIIDYIHNLKKSNKASKFIRDAIREKIDKENNIEIWDNKINLINEISELKDRVSLIEKGLFEAIINGNIIDSGDFNKNNFKEKNMKTTKKMDNNNEEELDESIENVLNFIDF